MDDLPLIDVSGLVSGSDSRSVADEIHAACRDLGFFYVVGHDVEPGLLERLDNLSRDFFALSESEKEQISMTKGGRAWRGWFGVGTELTSGVPDMKEGIYFGAEHASDHPLVEARALLHGPNLFPERPAELRDVVGRYMDAMADLAQQILRGIGIALGIGGSWFEENLTSDPVVLFRIFRYPPLLDAGSWSVGEHSDYGLLTLLAQDDSGGLEVRTRNGWIDAPPVASSFVCNLGDMLERLTGGLYRSTPHRVRNTTSSDRLSFPFFFDPSWDASVARLPISYRHDERDAVDRWDKTSVHALTGTYGDYLTEKVRKVFPALSGDNA